MKAVRLVTVLMFVLLMSGRQAVAQEVEASAQGAMENTETLSEIAIQEMELTGTIATEIQENMEGVVSEIEGAVTTMENEPAAAAETTEVMPDPVETPVMEEAKELPDQAIIDAVKAEVSERRKVSGKLDIFDGNINKVRTLDLIEFKSGTKQDGDAEVVEADFRDTSSGDIVTMDITVIRDNDTYVVKDMMITNAVAATAKEVKTDYTDEELKNFMKDYIDTQSQATGTFDLYDEKAQKMRNLEFVSLDEKVRRYGIIAIVSAEFNDKNTGDKVKVDVNAENKNGLGITAMRLKSVSKAAPQQ